MLFLCNCFGGFNGAHASPLDLTNLPLEELVETEVISATHFAQQMVDAPSAVSVVTADEIRRFGYRTIDEILDNMRGLHITRGLDYSYLGGRGYGAPGDYAGRIMILIDGYPAADNIFGQIFIAEDGYLDTALIERVEYAPGPGSAIYGNSAFLGVVNIITRKGRNFDGFQAEVATGSNNEQEGRITWGGRFDNGAELLVSASSYNSDGLSNEYDGGNIIASADRRSERFFVKGSYRNWTLQAASALQRQNNRNTFLDEFNQISDRNRFINLEHDAYLGRDWRSVSRLYYGDFQYEGLIDKLSYDERRDIETNGSWYGIDSKLIYLGFTGHQILLGSEYRVDQEQDSLLDVRTISDGEFLFADETINNGETFSFYAEDRITLTPTLSASLGGRYDRRHFDEYDTPQDFFNPRFALIQRPTEALSFKLSYGQASRFMRPDEYDFDKVDQPSRVRTTEFVAEHTTDQRRLLASLYRYRIDRLPSYVPEKSNTISGVELESEWQWPGARTLRLSYAWQQAENDQGFDLPNVPNHIGKLHVSTPIIDDLLRASLALRYVGERQDLTNGSLGGYTVADVTLTSADPLPGMDVSLGIRNLLDSQYDHVSIDGDPDGLLAQQGRTVWLRVGYRFQ